MIAPRSRRVHASFNQVVAATGRLSSSDPNLEHSGARRAVGKSARPFRFARLVFASGRLFADRAAVPTHFSQDPEFLAAFARDDDIMP